MAATSTSTPYDADGDSDSDSDDGAFVPALSSPPPTSPAPPPSVAPLSTLAPMPVAAVRVDASHAEGAHSLSSASASSPPHASPAVDDDRDADHRPAVQSPPYWQPAGAAGATSRHGRAASIGSVASTASGGGRRAPIRLEDHTEPPAAEDTPPTSAKSTASAALSHSALLWARVVHIPGHTLVAGAVRGVGDYVVWTCRVDLLDGGSMVLRKRYSEFGALRAQLADTFPRSAPSLPNLPPKSVLRRFQPGFLEKRRKGLEFFLNCTLLNPEFASSAILKEFVFG